MQTEQPRAIALQLFRVKVVQGNVNYNKSTIAIAASKF